MSTSAFVALHLVLLHTVDGRATLVNPDQVASISAHVEGEKNKVLVETVQCVIGLTNGKFISVIEPCNEVQQKLEAAK
jgi:uncharacterized protein YlzI (FlbEa/FlbD family)